MMRFLPLAVITVATAAACSVEPRSHSAIPDTSGAAPMMPMMRMPQSVAHTGAHPLDRQVRRDLNLAIARDPDLKNREISFVVRRGDLKFIGVVRSEAERSKINDLAMGIDGVKSVANAVRVSP